MALSSVLRESFANWKRGTAFLAAPTNVYLSLHSADPGLTGANELSGNGYARQVVTFNAPIDSGSDELLESSGTITFGPVTTSAWTVTHAGLWTAVTGGTFIEGGSVSSTGGEIVAVGQNFPFPVGAVDALVR